MIKLPLGVDINKLIDDIRILSWQAADILLYYSKLLKNSNDKKNILKNNNEEDPVTLADLKVNELIIKGINEKYKNVNWDILSEENVKISSKIFDIKTDWVWVLDPLDGTKDFIQGTGNYAMHLALNFKQKPYLGFVLIPEKDQLWITDGLKTWCEKRDGSKQEPILLHNKKLQEMTLVTKVFEVLTFSSLKISHLTFLYFSFILLIIISFTFKSAKVTGSSSLLFFKKFFLSSESPNNLE